MGTQNLQFYGCYNAYIGDLKPSFFMILVSKGRYIRTEMILQVGSPNISGT